MGFLDIGFTDILDIFLVASLLYQFYILIKGTVAMNVFVGLFFMYLIWLLVRALNMQLLSSILGQFMGVGVIALIIVFQQEIRRFLLIMGSKYLTKKNFSLEQLFSFMIKDTVPKIRTKSIVRACESMAKSKTGALIVITNKSELSTYIETGEIINATTTSRLLETIFFKNSPLHDGAVIIRDDKIVAARCVLPVSENQDMPKNLGLRHRSALGMSESTDAFVVIVSEERGHISIAQFGKIITNISPTELSNYLEEQFKNEEQNDTSDLRKTKIREPEIPILKNEE